MKSTHSFITLALVLGLGTVLIVPACSSKNEKAEEKQSDPATEDFIRRYAEWEGHQEYLSKDDNDQALLEFDHEVDLLISGKTEASPGLGLVPAAQAAHVDRVRKAYANRVVSVKNHIQALQNQNAAARQRIAQIRATRYLRPAEKNNLIAGIHTNINARIQQIGASHTEIARLNAEKAQAVAQAIQQVQASRAGKAATLQAKKTAIAEAKQRKLEALVDKLLGKSGLSYAELSERDKILLKRFAAKNDLVSFRKQVNLILTVKSNLPQIPEGPTDSVDATASTDDAAAASDDIDEAAVDSAISTLEGELKDVGG